MADRTSFPSEQADKFLLRMPDGMREWLKSEAAKNGRSMNAEIVFRLDLSQIYEDQPVLSDTIRRRLEDSAEANDRSLADEIEERLEFTLRFPDETFHPLTDNYPANDVEAIEGKLHEMDLYLKAIVKKLGIDEKDVWPETGNGDPDDLSF